MRIVTMVQEDYNKALKRAYEDGYDSGRNQWQDEYGFTVPNNTISSLESAAYAKGLKDKGNINKSIENECFKKGFEKGKEFNKDDQNLNYRMGYNDGWHDCEASFELGNEFTDSIQEQAYDEGYDQAIDDLIEAGVIGEDEGDYSDEDYSEYEFGDVKGDEEEYCFSKELERVLNGEFTSNINFDGNKRDTSNLDEYNRGYEDGKSRGITIGYNKRVYEESKDGGIDGSERKHSHYFKDVRHLDYVDVYQVCKLFEVDDPSHCIQHSIKKLLMSGKRGAKDKMKDIIEARDTLNRYLQIEGIE